MSEKKGWLVPYRATFRGKTYVEAETADTARQMVDDGDVELDGSEELVDWESVGDAEPNE